jgi:thymidylate synthase
MIQELIARELDLELGSYKHAVGSLHLYKANTDDALAFLDEGWQSTDQPMPSMPSGNPWPSVSAIVQLERALRLDEALDSPLLQSLNPYWADLVRLLQVFAISKKKKRVDITELTSQMSCEIYAPFIRARIGAMSS